jgi:hypothetical protein
VFGTKSGRATPPLPSTPGPPPPSSVVKLADLFPFPRQNHASKMYHGGEYGISENGQLSMVKK